MNNRNNINNTDKQSNDSNDVNNTSITESKKKVRTKKQKSQLLAAGQILIEKLAHKLNRHTERNTNVEYINKELYHILCHPFTYVNAYTRISKNKGALTTGVIEDDEVNKFFGQSNAIRIANKFKKKNYQWFPVRRVMIEKPGKEKKTSIDTPT